MPDPDIAKLATDPNARVMIFIDGQNLYHACDRLFGHPLCHPHLLAQHLSGTRTTNRVGCRFYTGMPNRNIPGEKAKVTHLDRRLSAMRAMGVTVITRTLRYHWDWGHREKLPIPEAGAAPQTVTLSPWQRPQEKGIDLRIGLDIVEFALMGAFDVAVVVSLDRDLYEIPEALANLKKFIKRPLRLEAAVPVPDGSTQPKTIARFHYTHQITSAVFALVRDDTNYTVPEDEWKPPTLPESLP